jgi:hypothetical protein
MSVKTLENLPVGALADETPAASVIKDARARQRRHRTAAFGVLLALILTAGAYLGAAGPGGGRTGNTGSRGGSVRARLEAAGAVLAQAPYMGVACVMPNWIGCDRIGLAVWLRRPALAVSANVDGSPFDLNDARWSGQARGGRRTMFAGFLQPAGLTTRIAVRPLPFTIDRWLGSNAPTPTVLLKITYAPRNIVRTHVTVTLKAGWG